MTCNNWCWVPITITNCVQSSISQSEKPLLPPPIYFYTLMRWFFQSIISIYTSPEMSARCTTSYQNCVRLRPDLLKIMAHMEWKQWKHLLLVLCVLWLLICSTVKKKNIVEKKYTCRSKCLLSSTDKYCWVTAVVQVYEEVFCVSLLDFKNFSSVSRGVKPPTGIPQGAKLSWAFHYVWG